ncbi:hypothetical protein SMD11_0406 [Streptomyces albireticuli]|uniref:Uncharacterized protein n=1 Tax=Streptomyces albireticuli TaxID=1940 RepID=A0A1Z2KVK3_9ACTN|nr:hypothetical protein [Streptomyces albireticuli]ARZ66072.1 hypothetical protein SMD11_0406 [Streptomyces albireticuli]
MTQQPEQYLDKVTAGPGGVMTDDVGVVTGDLTIVTTSRDGRDAEVTVQYTGAEEWYTMTGSPVPVPPTGLHALHDAVLAAARAGGGAEVPR